ncbi:MAG TPA: hypothetical protein VFQ72_02115 [Candidatus Paceibacterota bacterium]|nr:hypothetical protein [Candidatus Paceibacterota bacterium]
MASFKPDEILAVLFERHLTSLSRESDLQPGKGPQTVERWEIRHNIHEDEKAARYGRADLVKEKFWVGWIVGANDLYRAACMLYASGRLEDLPLCHMCVLRINDLAKGDPLGDSSPLSLEFREHFTALASDSWSALWNSLPPFVS